MTLDDRLKAPLSQIITEKVEGILDRVDIEDQSVILHLLSKLARNENIRFRLRDD